MIVSSTPEQTSCRRRDHALSLDGEHESITMTNAPSALAPWTERTQQAAQLGAFDHSYAADA